MTDADEANRVLCWDRALHAYGYARVFGTEARKIRGRLRWLTFLGVAVPLLVGSVALGSDADSDGFRALLVLAGVVGVAQLIGSAWSLVAGWDSALAYGLESTAENHRLADAYEQLARENPSDLKVRLALLEAEYKLRSDQDNRQVITEEAKRFGMRAALRKYRRNCVGCGIAPLSMDPSDCPVCGNFNKRRSR